MDRTGEREIPSIPGTSEGVDIKHTQRYSWASTYTKGKKVYDIACGSGYGSLFLQASQYHGFDNSTETIEYANLYYATQPSIKFSVANAQNLPNTLEVADVIISFETIEHLNNPDALLEWCSNHCQMLIISSPIRGSFRKSHFHVFEYRLVRFAEALNKYFSKITMFVQKQDIGIIYPSLPDDKGVAIAVCQP